MPSSENVLLFVTFVDLKLTLAASPEMAWTLDSDDLCFNPVPFYPCDLRKVIFFVSPFCEDKNSA